MINPDNAELRFLVSKMPNAALTEWGNFSIKTRVTARLNQFTYYISSGNSKKPTLPRNVYDRLALDQDNYVKKNSVLVMDGLIGAEEKVSAQARLIIESSAANIAAMQKQLYFPIAKSSHPDMTTIYTPNLSADFYGQPYLIAVDLDNYVTRIFGTDYFGESKKGGLRMWNKWIYDRGGLALHAGCKTYWDSHGKEWSIVIIGLSGTGKTTTTFHHHLNSQPVQDDFCAIFPDGRIYASENGCFAKTYRLSEDHEPLIYKALTDPQSWLENVYVDKSGRVDFDNGLHTTNGRGTFNLRSIPHRNPCDLPPISHIIFLNRNFDIIPGIARLDIKQVADYFLLGETTGTSAGGACEAGKSLRVPGTNPFFPYGDPLQAQRFKAIVSANPTIQVLLMNTGCIGGREDSPNSIKITIGNSSALIEALLTDQIDWCQDQDFGYEIAGNVIEGCSEFITNPLLFYQSTKRLNEYKKTISQLKRSRDRYLTRLK